ncbi:MAG: hypothetical protein DRN96_02065 [Thermoproteota archaeon]|nr:MAG: hypothetical protein DRN96_02065 [Candidatus Korarchaeota archaeon]
MRLISRLAKALGLRGHLEPMEYMATHVKYSIKAMEALIEMLDHAAAGREKEAYERLQLLHLIESEADTLRRETMEQLTVRGVPPPLSRQDMIRLMRILDMITDGIHDAGRLLSVLKMGEVCRRLYPKIRRLMELTLSCIRELEKSVELLEEDVRRSLEGIRRVEELERVCDIEYMSLLESFSEMDLKPVKAVLLRELLENVEKISDFCEDSADVLKLIAVRVG